MGDSADHVGEQSACFDAAVAYHYSRIGRGWKHSRVESRFRHLQSRFLRASRCDVRATACETFVPTCPEKAPRHVPKLPVLALMWTSPLWVQLPPRLSKWMPGETKTGHEVRSCVSGQISLGLRSNPGSTNLCSLMMRSQTRDRSESKVCRQKARMRCLMYAPM